MFAIIYIAATYGDADIMQTMPLLPGLLYSFLYVHNTINIQVSHVSKQKYSPWTKLWLVNILALLVFIALQTLNV